MSNTKRKLSFDVPLKHHEDLQTLRKYIVDDSNDLYKPREVNLACSLLGGNQKLLVTKTLSQNSHRTF